MIACYDLKRLPPTYDAVAFLALLELERIARKDKVIDLHILPGPNSGFRQDLLWPHTLEERIALRENVLVPLCELLPSVRSVTVRSDRNIEGWGKDQYGISLPAIVKALKAGSRPLRAPQVEKRPGLITFTLREAKHHSLRNSNVPNWLAATQALQKRGVEVEIIRDTRVASEGLADCWVNNVAATSLSRRADLYASAALNVGISNGPMWMSIFMDAPTLMLRPTTNAAEGCYDDRFFAKYGLNRGDQLPTSPSHQRLVWEDDTRENIVRAVEEMLEIVA